MQSYNDERDRLPMEDLFKAGKPVDMDWFYLENRIRTFIHDLVTPYAKRQIFKRSNCQQRTIEAKDQIMDIKENLINNQKSIDDLKMQLNTNDQVLKAIEKKLKDEIATINGQKNMLKEKLGQMESEVSTFKNQVIERNTEIKFLFDEIGTNKESLHNDIIRVNKEINDDMQVQQERIQELGEQVYTSLCYNKQKFQEMNKFDVKLNMAEINMKSINENITEFNSKLHELNKWSQNTDRHLQKILPLQVSSFVYEVLNTNLKSKLRPKLKENFQTIFAVLETNSKLDAQYTGDYCFKKGEYQIPQTIMRSSINNISFTNKNMNASMSSVPMSNESPQQTKNTLETKNENQRIFVLHHRRKAIRPAGRESFMLNEDINEDDSSNQDNRSPKRGMLSALNNNDYVDNAKRKIKGFDKSTKGTGGSKRQVSSSGASKNMKKDSSSKRSIGSSSKSKVQNILRDNIQKPILIDDQVNPNKMKMPQTHESGKQVSPRTRISNKRSKKTKNNVNESTTKAEEDSQSQVQRSKTKKTVIIINNPDELRSKVEKAVQQHFESEINQAKTQIVRQSSRRSSFVGKKQKSGESNTGGQGTTERKMYLETPINNPNHHAHEQFDTAIEEVAISQELSSPIKPQNQQDQKIQEIKRNFVQNRSSLLINLEESPSNKSLTSQNLGTHDKTNSIVDKLVNKISQAYAIPVVSQNPQIIKINGLEDSGKQSRREKFSRIGSKFDNSIKDFDIEGKNKDNLDEIEQRHKELDEELLDQQEEDDYYDEESDGGEFILEPVNPKDSKQVKKALKEKQKEIMKRKSKMGHDPNYEGGSSDDSFFKRALEQGENSSANGSSYESGSDSASSYSEMIDTLKHQVEMLKLDLNNAKGALQLQIVEATASIENKISMQLKKQNEQVYEVKLSLMDETSRIKRERTDFQIEIKKLRELVSSFANTSESHNLQFIKFQKWAKKVSDIMQMSSIIEAQEERDKHSIALIGMKESANQNSISVQDQSVSQQPQIQGAGNHHKGQPIVSIDNKCLNCSNQSGDRAILYSQFKIACLQYRPSNVCYKTQSYSKEDILNFKARQILELYRMDAFKDAMTPRANLQSAETNNTSGLDDERSMFLQSTLQLNLPNQNQSAQPINSGKRTFFNRTIVPQTQPVSPDQQRATTQYMQTRLNKREAHSKDNEYQNTINNYKTRKLMAIRPYSVAENFRMDDVSTQYNDEQTGKVNIIKHSVKTNTNLLPSQMPSTRGTNNKIKLDFQLTDHNSSIVTVNQSIDNYNNNSALPQQQTKYIGFQKLKQSKFEKL
ncbi:UNKNOWN [Stylonychia lemnae]|uniref:Uncharacterized protein n=1 Tax=Stylonychia lemnae TaxID=5949 RepID=A0A078BAI4_STYLE|nr:UNKNOWN [Stylonychia lemnae]|eukprot:CDW90573.1 UNKNOWN [Stylonychia lemnae]